MNSTSSSRVIASGTLGLFMAVTHLFALGPIIEPLEREFGWRRQDIAYSLVIINVIGIVMNPLVGLLIDRVGARRIAIPGLTLYLLSIALIATAGPGIFDFWLKAALVGFFLSFATSTVWLTGVLSHVTAGRGMAIAICLVGGSLAGTVLPYVTTMLTDSYGWRAALLAPAGFGLLVAMPLIWFWFSDARLQPNAAVAPPVTGLSVPEILRTRQYWQLAIGGFLAIAAFYGLVVHFVPMMTATGLDRSTAAAMAGAVGMGAIAGRLGCGYLLDRYHGGLVGGLALLLPIIPCLIITADFGSLVPAFACAVAIGLALGAETDVIAYLATRFFGLRNYGFAFGSLLGFLSLGVGMGPWAAAQIHDRFGSYELFQASAAAALAVSALLVAIVGRYPRDDAGH